MIHPEQKCNTTAFSLIELLTAMVIFTFVMFALTYALDASLGQLTKQFDESTSTGDLRTTLSTIRRDLQQIIVDRPNNKNLQGTFSKKFRQFADKRSFVPIEINRRSGSGGSRTFENSIDNSAYSTLLFASVTSPASYPHPIRERLRMSDKSGQPNIHQSPDAFSEICLVGYYVAFTNNSEDPDSLRQSMKLYRHFRSGGITYGDAHANGILARLSGISPGGTLTRRSFANSEFPFILSERYTDPDPALTTIVTPTQPWPRDGAPSRRPPAYDSDSWFDPVHPIHEYVFADEIVASNVVRFHCEPYRKVETEPGVIEIMNTEQLNAYLKLPNSDWPVFIKPDFIDITLGIVGEEIAAQMWTEQEWATFLEASEGRLDRRNVEVYSMRFGVN